ncbi:MAG: hypothetical protein JWN34_1981 [Bryobacterales bacterium]|nr:hypothetical protein [Bryobacterales bacterium]
MRLLPIFLLLVTGAFAQQPVAAIVGDQPTLALYGRLSSWTSRLEPALAQMKTEEWVSKGASETYRQQAASAVVQLKAIAQDMAEMQRHPDTLEDGMKALFRVQTFHRTMNSVLAGLRKYQNPALADLIVAMEAEATPDLQSLEEHLLEVASQREREYAVVEREAQRCRGVLTREPLPTPRTPVRKSAQ